MQSDPPSASATLGGAAPTTSAAPDPRAAPASTDAQLAQLSEEMDGLKAELALLRSELVVPSARKVAYFPPGSVVGEGVDIAPSVHLMGSPERPIHIGDRVKVLRGAEWFGPMSIGAGSYVNRDSYIRSDVTIGANVLLGPFVRLITDSHEVGGPAKRGGRNASSPITIGDGTWLGANVVVLGGVTIGRGSIVAAGAVVVNDVPEDVVVAGVPAVVVKRLES